MLKRDPTAASGRCLIPAVSTSLEAAEILSAHNISTVSATNAERIALARGLAQAQALLGKPVSFAKNVEFSFATRSGFSSYDGARGGRHIIKMNRCDSKGGNCAANNVAHLMHELGHKVGHAMFARGEKFYDAYSRLAGRCHPTRYSRQNRNEEFAEVFAAYLTHPELLSRGDPACRRAFAFFSRDVFKENGELASCDLGQQRVLMARANVPGRPTMVASVERQPAWIFGNQPDVEEDEGEEGGSGYYEQPYRARDRQQTAWLWGR